MTTPPTRPPGDDAPAPLCSVLSARAGLPLVGSAGCHDAVVAFELEAPWTARLVGSRAGGPALDAALARIAEQASGVRVLAVEPRGDTQGHARVLHFARDRGPFVRYRRREHVVPRDELPALLEAIALDGDGPGGTAVGDDARDLLVCTHGSRDACCGKFGYRLFADLERLAAADPAVRVWRCSHLGGHRFAPTLLDLPSGRVFGRVGADDAARVLAGGDALAARAGVLYRGRACLPEPVQVVEREAWMECGARFEDASLDWSVDEEDGGWNVRLDAVLADGHRFARSARVERAAAEAVATPASCGRDPETEQPWRIVG